jgi:PAS domain S-box-containing protein
VSGVDAVQEGDALSEAVPVRHRPVGSSSRSDAGTLGLLALAEVVGGLQDAITVCDAERRFVFANSAACQMLGLPFEQLRGRDFLDVTPARERETVMARFAEPGRASVDASDEFTGILSRPDGTEREMVSYSFPIDMAGAPHSVMVLRDVTDTRAASRTAAALAQAAAQLVGTGTTTEILVGMARHAVQGTRALQCGIAVVGDDHNLILGGYKPMTEARRLLSLAPPEEVIEGMTAGRILVGAIPGAPVVLPDARAIWEAHPAIKAFASALNLDWQAGVYLPLSWEGRVMGLFGVYLPRGLTGPSEAELSFYTALADQCAVAVTNAQLASQAREAAALQERARLARELHDSVSQALFSMTMHARAAQLAMGKGGVDENGQLGRSVAQLAELARGALAEMRALIFELRPGALAEEGLVAALTKRVGALNVREEVTVTMEGPEQRLELPVQVEEHLYRIATEALHNVVKHAGADRATVSVSAQDGAVDVVVRDNGSGFDLSAGHPGHIGLSTMAERAEAIGAELTVTSEVGAGTTVAVSLHVDRAAQAPAATESAPSDAG